MRRNFNTQLPRAQGAFVRDGPSENSPDVRVSETSQANHTIQAGPRFILLAKRKRRQKGALLVGAKKHAPLNKQ